MKDAIVVAILLACGLLMGCDRRDEAENAPTPQPNGEVKSAPTDPEQPTAPVEGDAPDHGTPADPKSGT